MMGQTRRGLIEGYLALTAVVGDLDSVNQDDAGDSCRTDRNPFPPSTLVFQQKNIPATFYAETKSAATGISTAADGVSSFLPRMRKWLTQLASYVVIAAAHTLTPEVGQQNKSRPTDSKINNKYAQRQNYPADLFFLTKNIKNTREKKSQTMQNKQSLATPTILLLTPYKTAWYVRCAHG